jgi:hypothetical protein
MKPRTTHGRPIRAIGAARQQAAQKASRGSSLRADAPSHRGIELPGSPGNANNG